MFARLRPLAHILCQINPILSVPFCFFKIHFNFSLPSSPRSSKLSPSVRFPHRKPPSVLLSSPMRATFSTHHHSITLIVPGTQYKSRSSLCNFLQSAVASSLSTLLSNTFSRCPSPNVTTFITNVTQPAKLQSLCL